MKFCHKTPETLGYNMVKTQTLYLTGLELVPSHDGQRDKQTDEQNYRS